MLPEAPGLFTRGWESCRDRATMQTIGRKHRGPGEGPELQGQVVAYQAKGPLGPLRSAAAGLGAQESGEEAEQGVGCEGRRLAHGSVSPACLPNCTSPQGWQNQAAGRKRKDGTAPQGQQWGVVF